MPIIDKKTNMQESISTSSRESDKEDDEVKLNDSICFGPLKTKLFVKKGYICAKDLWKNSHLLSNIQFAAIKYKTLEDEIQREEIDELKLVLEHQIRILDHKYVFTICGDYRRGLDKISNTVVVVSYSEECLKNDNNIRFYTIMKHLVSCGLIVDPLDGISLNTCIAVWQQHLDSNYHLIKFVYVPSDQYYCAILFHTGPDRYVRKIQEHATSVGLSLEKYSLKRNFCGGLILGDALHIENEPHIFYNLKLHYTKPENRY